MPVRTGGLERSPLRRFPFAKQPHPGRSPIDDWRTQRRRRLAERHTGTSFVDAGDRTASGYSYTGLGRGVDGDSACNGDVGALLTQRVSSGFGGCCRFSSAITAPPA